MAIHTDRVYENELQALRHKITTMGELVARMLEDAIYAFSQNDMDRARRTAAADLEVDKLELEVDEMCLTLLARRQPVASDLRFITATMKMVTDLERVGDLTANIAERLTELDGVDVPGRFSILEIARTTQEMLTTALRAYRMRDADLAQAVLARDNAVDNAYAALFPELMDHMMRDSSQVFAAQRAQSIAKYLERIADHATNIVESVTFIVNGRDVRHQPPPSEE